MTDSAGTRSAQDRAGSFLVVAAKKLSPLFLGRISQRKRRGECLEFCITCTTVYHPPPCTKRGTATIRCPVSQQSEKGLFFPTRPLYSPKVVRTSHPVREQPQKVGRINGFFSSSSSSFSRNVVFGHAFKPYCSECAAESLVSK